MADLNPQYVHVVIDHFRPRLKAEQDRVAAEMQAAFPGCWIMPSTYDVDHHLKHPGPWAKEEVALALVQCRTGSGGTHSATITAGLATGEVWVTGWPLEAESG
jgi:hypothetical protein